MKHIIAFSGSLRKASTNTGLLRAAADRVPEGMKIEILDIGWLPAFNQDVEASYPADIAALKDKIKKADGIIFATPEYNRSIPGLLKNMIDWVSRPYGETTFANKPVAVMGATPGNVGTALAQYDLKKIMLYLGARVLGQPEFYVSSSTSKFDAEGNLIDEKTKEYIAKLLTALQASIS